MVKTTVQERLCKLSSVIYTSSPYTVAAWETPFHEKLVGEPLHKNSLHTDISRS